MNKLIKNTTPTAAHGISWALASQMVFDPIGAAESVGMNLSGSPIVVQIIGFALVAWAGWHSAAGRDKLRKAEAE